MLKMHGDMHNILKALRLLIYSTIWIHSSMNYLSLLLFRQCPCFIIYLIKHKVYCIYKYTTGMAGMGRIEKKNCAEATLALVLARDCHSFSSMILQT